MSRWMRLCGVIMLACAIPAAARCYPPVWTAHALPTPPRGDLPWTPPAEAPADLVSVATTLFGQGLPDPRGCEYRQAVVDNGRVWLADKPTTVHGWVLPEIRPGEPRFVIGWNGRISQVLSVGEPADLAADAEAPLHNQAEVVYERLYTGYRQTGNGTGPPTLVAPLSACLLLRVGQTDAACRTWAAWKLGIATQAHRPDTNFDGYALAAGEWTGGLVSAAAWAHETGGDRLSLLLLRLLARVGPLVEAECRRRGLPNDLAVDHGPYQPWLQAVPQMLADQERRALSAPPPPAAAMGRAAFASQAEYVAALVDSLEEIDASLGIEPGGPIFYGEQSFEALVAEGEAAVAPLSACLESDDRLTRAFDDSMRAIHPTPVPCWVVARQALCRLLGDAVSRVRETRIPAETRLATVAAAKSYWARLSAMPAAERWCELLREADRPERWTAAARELTRAGQPNPAAADLLALCMADMPRQRGYDAGTRWRRMCELAQALIACDGAHRLPDLRRATSAAGQATDDGQRRDSQVLSAVVQLYRQRQALGDATALADYADWVTALPPAYECPADLFAPLWLDADQPAVRGLAERLFKDPKSAWNLAAGQPSPVLSACRALSDAPLLTLPAVRGQMLRALSDTTRAGAVRGEKDRPQVWDLPGSRPGFWLFGDRRASVNLRPGESHEFRVCDLFAAYLSRTWGMPACDLPAPVAQRDAAVAETARILRCYGPRFRLALTPRLGSGAVLDLPRLDRPAEQADIDAGRAVFTLGHQRATRVVALQAYPTSVAWVQPDGTTCAGRAQQAEERLERGGWRRYIGYVGELGMAMVPAEQIEYAAPPAERWTRLAGGLDARLLGPEPDQPTSVTLWLRNRRAVPQQTHTVWLRPTAEGLAGLRQGIELRVGGKPSNPPAPVLQARRGFPDAGWLRELAPGETLNAGRLDLRRVYGELAPGVYNVMLDVSGVTGGSASTDRVWATVTVPAP